MDSHCEFEGCTTTCFLHPTKFRNVAGRLPIHSLSPTALLPLPNMDCSLILLLLLLCCFVLPTSTTPAKPKAIRQGFTKEPGTPKTGQFPVSLRFHDAADAPIPLDTTHPCEKCFICLLRFAFPTVWRALLRTDLASTFSFTGHRLVLQFAYRPI